MENRCNGIDDLLGKTLVGRAVRLVFFLFCTAIFTAAVINWPGSIQSYVILSIVSHGLLLTGLCKRVSAGHLFLSVTLWIGYWLKISIHTIWPAMSWAEPTGGFDFKPWSWDQVAWISSVGLSAMALVGLLWRDSNVRKMESSRRMVAVSDRFRFAVWAVSFGCVLASVFINEFFDVQHAGIRPPDFGWPLHLQGLLCWFLVPFCCMALLVPVSFDFKAGRPVPVTAILALSGASLIALSLASRGIVAYFSLYLLLTVFLHGGADIRKNKKMWLSLITVCFIATGLTAVLATSRRSAWRAELGGIQTRSQTLVRSRTPGGFYKDDLIAVARLPVDRWIGLEGVMAISAYPGKGLPLLWQAITEDKPDRCLDLFTGQVCGASLENIEQRTYGSLPGMFGFWFYSGSLMVVWFAVFLFVIIVVAVEKLILTVSENAFFAVYIGLEVAIVTSASSGGLVPFKFLVLELISAIVLGKFAGWCVDHFGKRKLNGVSLDD